MDKLTTMIANGELDVEELTKASELIKRAKLVKEGIEACKKTIVFPLGTSSVSCYSNIDKNGEYESWGACTIAGTFTCSTNWGGDREIGRCNITSFQEVFLAFDNKEFVADLRRFLEQQIEKAKKQEAKVEVK